MYLWQSDVLVVRYACGTSNEVHVRDAPQSFGKSAIFSSLKIAIPPSAIFSLKFPMPNNTPIPYKTYDCIDARRFSVAAMHD